MKKVKIGIPRALLYYKYHVLWENFFKLLGCEVIISDKTNKEILNNGLALAVDESCLSLKLFLGHIDNIKDKVDYILISRIITLGKKEEEGCVKFAALYDIVNNTFDNIKIIEYTIDVEKRQYEMLEFLKIGTKISKNPIKALNAYLLAKKKENEYKLKLAKEQDRKLRKTSNNLKILIVSHPYNIYDDFLGKPITNFLEKQKVEVFFADLFDHHEAKFLSKNISRDIYWTYNKELLGAVEYYKNKVDGIIFIVTFPCGPDSLMTELCQRRIKKVPVMSIVIDELQGEAGLRTRLESFVDIIKMKKKNEKKKN